MEMKYFIFHYFRVKSGRKRKCRAESVTTLWFMAINHKFMGTKYKQRDWNFVVVAQKCQYQLKIHCFSGVSLYWDALPKTVEIFRTPNITQRRPEKHAITICQVAFKFHTLILVQIRRNSLFAQYVPREFHSQFSFPRKTVLCNLINTQLMRF